MNDRSEVLAFLNVNALGQLISKVNGRLFDSHIAFLVYAQGTVLRAHLAKANWQPWQPAYKEGMLRGITGLEIEITDIQCIYRLSQNRSEADRARVIQKLEGLGWQPLVEAMKKIE